MSVVAPNERAITTSQPSETFRSETASVIRRNRWWLALAASPLVVSLGLVVTALVTAKAAFLAPVFHFGILGLVALLFAYKRNRNPSFLGGEVTADPTGVHFRGEMLVRREDIKQGFVVPTAKGHAVRLIKNGIAPSQNIAVKDVEEGRALLRALGLDASQSVAEVKALSRIFSWSGPRQMAVFLSPVLLAFLGMLGAGAALGPKAAGLGSLLMVLGYAFVFTMTLARTKVQVGADGILTSWFGKERFFPFSQIEWVNPYEGRRMNKTYVGVELVLRSGEAVRLLTGQKRWADEEASLLVERIRESIETYSSGVAGDDASVLARNGREPKDWVTRLRSIGAGSNADMRTSPIPIERLWRIVEDASASAVARASAAIALGSHVPPSEKLRIKHVAQATASPKLRIALEHAADRTVSDSELAASLAELEAESEQDSPKQVLHEANG